MDGAHWRLGAQKGEGAWFDGLFNPLTCKMLAYLVRPVEF